MLLSHTHRTAAAAAAATTMLYSTRARPALSLQQFIQRGQVLSTYRKFMRLTKRIPDKKDKKETRAWIRGDFERYRSESDGKRVEVLLAQASRQYKELSSGIFSMI